MNGRIFEEGCRQDLWVSRFFFGDFLGFTWERQAARNLHFHRMHVESRWANHGGHGVVISVMLFQLDSAVILPAEEVGSDGYEEKILKPECRQQSCGVGKCPILGILNIIWDYICWKSPEMERSWIYDGI